MHFTFVSGKDGRRGGAPPPSWLSGGGGELCTAIL